MVGDFDTDNFNYMGASGNILWLYFVITTLILTVVILNMIIAIMGDTFDRMIEHKDEIALQAKYIIVADYEFILPTSAQQKQNFLFLIKNKQA